MLLTLTVVIITTQNRSNIVLFWCRHYLVRAIWHTFRKSYSPLLPDFVEDTDMIQLLSPSCIAANFDQNEDLSAAVTLRDVTDVDVSVIIGNTSSIFPNSSSVSRPPSSSLSEPESPIVG